MCASQALSDVKGIIQGNKSEMDMNILNIWCLFSYVELHISATRGWRVLCSYCADIKNPSVSFILWLQNNTARCCTTEYIKHTCVYTPYLFVWTTALPFLKKRSNSVKIIKGITWRISIYNTGIFLFTIIYYCNNSHYSLHYKSELVFQCHISRMTTKL